MQMQIIPSYSKRSMPGIGLQWSWIMCDAAKFCSSIDKQRNTRFLHQPQAFFGDGLFMQNVEHVTNAPMSMSYMNLTGAHHGTKTGNERRQEESKMHVSE